MIIITKEIMTAKKEISHDIVADINNIKKFKKDLSRIKKDTPILLFFWSKFNSKIFIYSSGS